VVRPIATSAPAPLIEVEGNRARRAPNLLAKRPIAPLDSGNEQPKRPHQLKRALIRVKGM